MTRWGKAGVRLPNTEIARHNAAARAARRRRDTARAADDRVAYRLWRAGELKPYLITLALDARGLDGPEVDQACGVQEPDVDLWEAGKLYPTWQQLLLLAALCGVTPRLLCTPRDIPAVAQTSLRFHGFTDGPPPVRAFKAQAVAATVAGSPTEPPVVI